jgi:AcrR family transcriptional regulator
MPSRGKRRHKLSVSDERSEIGLRERKKVRTRAAIQAEALRLFREQGYDATTVEQIIRAADVSESTFFRYFPTKKDVVLWDDYDPMLIQAIKKAPSGLDAIQALRAAFGKVIADLPPGEQGKLRERLLLILSVPELRAATLDEFATAMRLLAEAVAERAQLDADDFAVRTVAGAVIGVCMAALFALADDPEADIAALLDEALAHLEAGLEV